MECLDHLKTEMYGQVKSNLKCIRYFCNEDRSEMEREMAKIHFVGHE